MKPTKEELTETLKQIERDLNLQNTEEILYALRRVVNLPSEEEIVDTLTRNIKVNVFSCNIIGIDDAARAIRALIEGEKRWEKCIV